MSLYLNCFVSSLITHKLVCEQIFLLEIGLFIKWEPKTKDQAWFKTVLWAHGKSKLKKMLTGWGHSHQIIQIF